jgi:uncharacterized protein (TIGR02646 family)
LKRVFRPELGKRQAAYLVKRQTDLAGKVVGGPAPRQVEKHWGDSRKTKMIGDIFLLLKSMAGGYERCMYCMDSHGCDIEHFRPKSTSHEFTYSWVNMLLCCTECGRIKGDDFPELDGVPLLVNPADENPWHFLDFDPQMGIITPVYDLESGQFNAKGRATVQTLALDRREALQNVYIRAFKRLSRAFQDVLEQGLNAPQALQHILDEDDCGLAGWCFSHSGAQMSPMIEIIDQRADVWEAGIAHFADA